MPSVNTHQVTTRVGYPRPGTDEAGRRMSMKRFGILAVVLSIVACLASGCLNRGPKPDPWVNPSLIIGSVTLGDTGYPIYGAPVVCGDTVDQTAHDGTWVFSGNAGTYTCTVTTLFGTLSETVTVGVEEQKRIQLKAPVPDEFDPYVFEDISAVTVAIGRWANGTTIKYYFDGGTPTHRQMFRDALHGWLSGTGIVEAGLLNTVEVENREDANLVVSWGNTNSVVADMHRTHHIDSHEITYATIKINSERADATLPYYRSAGYALGLVTTSRDMESVMSEWIGDADSKVPTTADKVYLKALYSMPIKYSTTYGARVK